MPSHGTHAQYVDIMAATLGEHSHLEARIMNVRREVQKDATLVLSAAVVRLTGALMLTADTLDDMFPDDPDPAMQQDLRALAQAEEVNMQSMRSLLRV